VTALPSPPDPLAPQGPSCGRRFALIVFDWDGTLIDSAGAIVTAVQAASRDIGLEVPSEAQTRHIIGLGLVDAMAYLFPRLDPQGYLEVAERYRHHFLKCADGISLFGGIRELLDELSANRFLLGVATGKSRDGLERDLKATGLKSLFHATRCADEGFSKPHPGMLLEIIDELGVSAEVTLMIGDTSHDLEMARNAKIAGVAVTYGAHARESLLDHAPLACVDSVVDLRAWIAANA
jgi:phosphoglycolate phosphatase